MIIYRNPTFKIEKHTGSSVEPLIVKFINVMTRDEFIIHKNNVEVGSYYYTIHNFNPEDGEYQYYITSGNDILETGIMLKGLSASKPIKENNVYIYGEE